MSTFGRLGVPEERARLVDAIKAANGRQNVYFGVNPRKAQMLGLARAANAADVETRRGVFLDLDAKDATDADPDGSRTLAALGELGPCLVLGSGNGYHVHLSAEPVTDAGALAASISPLAASMARMGADNMADLPRIARMPFTLNLPKANKRQRGAVPRLAMPAATSVAVPPSAPRPLADLCRDLGGVASRLGLPGTGAVL